MSARLAPPGDIEALLWTGKLAFAGTAGAFGEEHRVFHSLAPLDPALRLDELWPTDASRLARSATVYDCIPALDPQRELAEAPARAAYLTRFELLRAADQLHVLSASVARDLDEVLGRPAHAVVTGAAPAPEFRPPEDREAATRTARLGVVGLTRPFVFYPTGSHPRKNNERLVEAWAALPRRITDAWQLVFAGELPASTSHHLTHLAASLGLPGGVLVTGFVSDELLLALYQAADLVCFPSLAEGYGLPVAEALACGTPVIAADRSPLDELVGASRRFDPERVDAIATAIEAALDAPPAASDPPATPLNWHDVAQRTGRAFDELLARPGRRPFRSARATRRIAFVSPLPPAPSGIASYSYRLIEELVATGEVAIDAFGDGPTPDQRAPSGVEAFHATSLPCVEEVRGGYDAVVYCLGNSHHHLGALSVLRRRPGIVLAHDVRLTNLYRHEHGDPGFLPGGLGRAIAAMYGQELPSDLGADGSLSPADVARYGLLMAREVLEHSSRWLVTSRAAAELSVLEVGPDLAERVAVLPFAVEAPGATGDPGFASDDAVPAPALAPALAMSWGRLAGEVEPGRPVVGHFGIVDPVKAPELLVEAFARLRRDGAGAPPLLVFVGPVGNEVAYRLAEQVLGLGLEHDVVLTGPLRHDAYRDWLGRASVAVQLRRSTNGEASAAIGECLASGVATVASRLGWVRELPDEAVVKVDSPIEAAELASVLDALLADDQRRAALGRAARDEAARRTFAATARRLLDVVEDERRATS